jgi:peptidoglycan/xylan/chitin deacetylase (PgdA/CDA1 family)
MRRTLPQAGLALLAATAVAAIVGLTFAAGRLAEGPPLIGIRVNGELMQVEMGTTFGELVRREDLHARAGRLLDVEGDILQRRADPGEVLLNGGPPSRSAALRAGDSIEVDDGEDMTEPTVKLVQKLPTPVAPNPASVIGTSEAEDVTVRGKLSGKVLREFTRPTGVLHRPREVALTFDDGPWPRTTRKILDILARHEAKASFFVVGYLAERYPMLVRREVSAGMTVANHSWSHPAYPAFQDLASSRTSAEMSRPNELIERYGTPVRLFRPPGGSWDDDVRQAAAELGMRLVLWDVDPLDWRHSATPKRITKRVLSNVGPGSIVLLHDGGGDGRDTIAALPDIIKGIRKQGLKLVAL